MWRSWHWSFWVLLCSKRRNFGAQLVEFGRHRADRGGHLGFGEARGDVLRAIPFPADDVAHESPLGRRAIGRALQPAYRRGLVLVLSVRRISYELPPVAVRLVPLNPSRTCTPLISLPSCPSLFSS